MEWTFKLVKVHSNREILTGRTVAAAALEDALYSQGCGLWPGSLRVEEPLRFHSSVIHTPKDTPHHSLRPIAREAEV